MLEIKEDVVHIFRAFWECGVHRGNWCGDTHILYEFGTSPATTDFRNIVTNDGDGGQHAEIKLIYILDNHIAQMVKCHQRKEIYLNMYMNRSPCYKCAFQLIRFKNYLYNKGYDIRITIKAAQPYMCKRITCSSCVEGTSHSDGLRELNRNGIFVNAWVWADWQFLAAYLNGLVRVCYDEKFPESGHGKRESRSMADEAAQEDFNALR